MYSFNKVSRKNKANENYYLSGFDLKKVLVWAVGHLSCKLQLLVNQTLAVQRIRTNQATQLRTTTILKYSRYSKNKPIESFQYWATIV